MLSNQSHMYSSYADPNTTARIDKSFSFGFGKPLIVEKEERVSVNDSNESLENEGKLRNWQSNFNRFSFDNVKAAKRGQDFKFTRPTNVQQYYRKSQKKEDLCNIGEGDKSMINFSSKVPRKQFHKEEYCKENQYISYKNIKIESNPESSEKVISQEWRKEKEKLQAKVKEIQGDNYLLKKQVGSLRNEKVEKELQLKGMKEQLDNVTIMLKKQSEIICSFELEKISLNAEIQMFKGILKSQQKKRNSLEIKNTLNSLTIPPAIVSKKLSLQSECQTVPENSFLQDYNEVVSFLGIKVTQNQCRSQLLSKVKQIFQDLSKKATKMAVLQLQKTKLKNNLRGHQMEIGHLTSQNSFLHQQLTKYHHLIDEYNEEISILNLREIELKMRFKSLKGDDQTEGSSSDRYLP